MVMENDPNEIDTGKQKTPNLLQNHSDVKIRITFKAFGVDYK